MARQFSETLCCGGVQLISNDHIFSTQWVTNGGVVQEILWELDVVSVTQTMDLTTTVTVTPTVAVPAKMRRHHVHGHRH